MTLADGIMYTAISVSAFVIEKVKKKANISLLSAPISLSIGLLAAAMLVLAWQFAFLFTLLCIGLILQVLAKVKFIAATVTAVMALLLAWIPVVGQVLGIIVSFYVIITFPAMVAAAFKDSYAFIVSKLRFVQYSIRQWSDRMRARAHSTLKPAVAAPEFMLSSGLSLWGVFACIDWLDGPQRTLEWPWSALVLGPWGIVAFTSYRRDTDSSPSTGDGAELPVDLMSDGT